MPDLCVCMRDVISELCSDVVSVLYPVSHVFREQIACGVHHAPWDAVSAWRMMHVKTVFAVCMSGGGRMSEKEA